MAPVAKTLRDSSVCLDVWTEVKRGYRWRRGDGAVAMWDDRSPHPNPCNPRSRLWTCWEPEPSQQAVLKEVGRLRRAQDGRLYHLRVRRRFQTAQAAMRFLDKHYPPRALP